MKNWGEKIISSPLLGTGLYIRIVMIMALEQQTLQHQILLVCTIFARRNIHQYTWTSPDGMTKQPD